MATEYEYNDEWLPWKFKRQRSAKLPGCQDNSWLPTLDEGQSSCGESQLCFFFSCIKCSPMLALDNLNPQYRAKVEYIPRISDIPPPDPFEEDNKYYGEIHELYFRYFAQIKKLRGVAINGWSSQQAKYVFDNVDSTFQGTKYHRSKGFEIDWILFNGKSVTVIEVQLRGKNSKSVTMQFLRKAMETVRRNQIIMQHLMDATRNTEAKVNYVIACPNVSKEQAMDDTLLRTCSTSFQRITSQGNGLGIISEENMGRKNIYVYNARQKKFLLKNFVQFIDGDVDSCEKFGQQTVISWGTNYKLMASSLILSMHLKPATVQSKQGEEQIRTTEIRTTENTEIGCKCQFRPRKNTAKMLWFLKVKNWAHFPKNLFLGPDHLEVLRSQSKRIILMGEPGCGKSLFLLALLFKYTSKNVQPDECKTVWFIIPQEKIEFRKYLEDFIDTHCQREHVKLGFSTEQISESPDLILIDEIPFTGLEETELLKYTKVYWSSASAISHPSCYCSTNDFAHWNVFKLRTVYTRPTNLALRYTKIRRLCKIKNRCKHQLILTFLQNRGHIIGEDEIQILKYNGDTYKYQLPQRKFNYESLLLVTVETTNDRLVIDKTVDHNASNFDQYSVHRITISEESDFDFISLPFTGVSYDTVVIIFGSSINFDSLETETFIFEVLYHTISRSLKRLVVLCHESFYKPLTELLSLDELDMNLFSRLREGRKLSKEEFGLLSTENDILESSEILISRKDFTQLQRLWSVLPADNAQRIEKMFHIVTAKVAEQVISEDTVEKLDILSSFFTLILCFSNIPYFPIEKMFVIAYTAATDLLTTQLPDNNGTYDLLGTVGQSFDRKIKSFIPLLAPHEVMEVTIASVHCSDCLVFSWCASRLRDFVVNREISFCETDTLDASMTKTTGHSEAEIFQSVSNLPSNYESFLVTKGTTELEDLLFKSAFPFYCKEGRLKKQAEQAATLELIHSLTSQSNSFASAVSTLSKGTDNQELIKYCKALENICPNVSRQSSDDLHYSESLEEFDQVVKAIKPIENNEDIMSQSWTEYVECKNFEKISQSSSTVQAIEQPAIDSSKDIADLISTSSRLNQYDNNPHLLLGNLFEQLSEILRVISSIRNQNSLKWMFSVDVMYKNPPLEDSLQLAYYNFIQTCLELDTNKNLVEEFCISLNKVIGEYADGLNFNENLKDFWRRVYCFIEKMNSEAEFGSSGKLSENILFILQNAFSRESGIISVETVASEENNERDETCVSEEMIAIEVTTTPAGDATASQQIVTSLANFSISEINSMSEEILEKLKVFKNRESLKSMFHKNAVNKSMVADDSDREPYGQFLQYMSENQSKEAADYFCERVYYLVSEERDIRKVHTVLVILWTRISCLIKDRLQKVNDSTDQQPIHVLSNSILADFQEIMDDSLNGNYCFLQFSHSLGCGMERWPIWFCKWYYLNVFSKSKFWRKNCSRRTFINGCDSKCILFTQFCFCLVIACTILAILALFMKFFT